jgi:putative addiction module component (TIGR02574 family)
MTALTPELIATLQQLSADDKDRVVELLMDDEVDPKSPVPSHSVDEIARRIEDVDAGRVTPLSRDEAAEQVRQAMRGRGIEL